MFPLVKRVGIDESENHDVNANSVNRPQGGHSGVDAEQSRTTIKAGI